jgi:hypothetical protein
VVPLFPDDAKCTSPALRVWLYFDVIELDDPNPALLLVTRAPMFCAQVSASTCQLVKKLPNPLHGTSETETRADATSQFGATPTTPIPLLMVAETHPATAVPWLSQKFPGSPPVPVPEVVKSAPLRCVMSGWFC